MRRTLAARSPLAWGALVLGLLSTRCHAPSSVGAEAEHVPERALLVALAPQRNIRSGRHVDMAPADGGGVVLASFHRPTPADDPRLWIAKLDAEGRASWTVGTATPGRATSVARAPDGTFWVCGWAQGAFEWEEEAGAELRSFLIHLDADGGLLAARFGSAGALPFLVRARADGALLVVGQGEGSIAWDAQGLFELGDAYTFVGRFGADGRCHGLTALSGGVTVSQCAPDPEGGFVLGGKFVGFASFGETRLETGGSFDSDGLLMRVDAGGALVWMTALGAPGHPDPDSRSREAVRDLVVAPDGAITAAAILDGGAGGDELALVRVSLDGASVEQQRIASDARPPAGVVLALTADGGVLLAHARRPGPRDGARELVLERFGREGRSLSRCAQPSSVNSMFRAAAARGDALWLAGHFQGSMAWGSLSLANDGSHQLFVSRQPLR